MTGTEPGEVGIDHVVQFYRDDDELTAAAGPLLVEALGSGGSALIVCGPEHAAQFFALLAGAGLDVVGAVSSGQLTVLDALASLDRLMVDGRPDPIRFEVVIGSHIRRAAVHGPVWAFGEMVALLWEAGNVTAALELEDLWNDLEARTSFSLYCAYPFALMEVPGADAGVVCGLHSGVIGVVPGGWGNIPVVEENFSADLLAPRQARRFVVGVLERWGAAHLVDDAALVVSELATNAVLHAASHFTVEVKADADAVLISVTDDQTVLPTATEQSALGESGRGLSLVASLARGWGVQAVAGGKVVWAELAR